MSYKKQSTYLAGLNRINNAIDYIEQNLDGDLSLKKMAQIACYSPFHFHRIFATVTEETIHEFVNRKRIEKIATILLKKEDVSIKELSLKYGFDNPVSFSRAFKKFYGISASDLKRKSDGNFNKISKQNSKIGKETISIEKYICNVECAREWVKTNGLIEQRILPESNLAYVRNRGSFNNVYPCFKKLKHWAQPMGLLNKKEVKWLMVVHDNPAVTDEISMMQSACLLLEENVKVTGEVGTMIIPKGHFLIGRFQLSDNNFKKAWDGMSVWVSDFGYTPRDGHYFELFHTNSIFEEGQTHVVDICIPIE